MKAEDLRVIQAISGNDRCCDCGVKHPQWASVSFGNLFCLECSGVHRSLGVHITFVRSIAMDSWTPAQLKVMKAGGNDKMNSYLYAKGISKTASIKEKYDSDAAALYKEVIKARVDGRPEPTELVKKPPRRAAAPAPAAAPKGSSDVNGMEKLAGETDAQYIARQTRLREEAKARMASKFGNSNGGKRTMGGVGSGPHPSQGGGVGGINLDSFSDTFSSGLGTAASGFSSVFSMAKETVTSDSAKSVAKDVGSMGLGLWSAISTSAKDVASNLNIDGLDLGGGNGDGLSALNEKAKRERSMRGGSTAYSGFGSGSGASAYSNNMNGTKQIPSKPTAAPVVLTAHNQNSAAPLPGESDAQYMQRQMRIREEAKAKAAATTVQRTKVPATKPKPVVAKMAVDADDDFFSSFGA